MTTKRRFIKHLPLMLAGLAMGLGVFINVNISNNKVEETNAATDVSTYYDTITATSGTTLLGQLHDLSIDKHTYYNSYSGDNSTTNCIKTDPYENTSYIRDFYSGAPTKNQTSSSGTVGWNREHVWCQNLSNNLYGTTGAGADIQHIRPTIPSINSDRGDKKYGELNNSGNASTATDANGNTVSGGYYTSSVFQPMNNKKGDAARIVMYLYMHYNKASNVGGTKDGKTSSYFGTLNFTNVISANSESAAIQLLLTWNEADPVDNIETTRNDEAAKITGCRNPFIDHPEYANMIWGSGSSSSDPSATISPSSPSVAAGSTVSLTATLTNVTNENQITWESDTSSVATVAQNSATTTSSTATVTGVAAGSAKISCKYNNTEIGNVTVTVTSSGGSGGSSNEYSLYSGNISEGDYLIVYDNKAMNTTITSNRLMFETVSPSNNKISTNNSSIVWHIAQDSSYWTIYNSGESKYAASTNSNNQATLISSLTDNGRWTVSSNNGTYDFLNKSNSRYLRENTTYGYGCYATSTGGALSLYKRTESSSKTLSSISLSNETTSYYVGDDFVKPTVTATFSDSSTADVTNNTTFSGYNMATAGTQTVTASYTYNGTTKTASYSITVTAKTITSISASVDKTFYVGETISTSDITVVDNNDDPVESFTFSNNNYQFTYQDAASGGALTSKTFTNAIAKGEMTCSLTVQVQRKAFVSPTPSVSDTLTRETTGISNGTTDYSSWSGKQLNSNAIYAGQSAGGNDSIQLRSNNNNSGIVQTTSGGQVTSIDVSWNSNTTDGRKINIYGKNTAFSSPSDLYTTSTQGTLLGTITKGTTSLNITGSYSFIGIRSASGALYLTSVTFNIAGSSIDASNLANYIMYEDTNNQCTTKLSATADYIKSMPSNEKTSFQTSNDYVIFTARTRLNAWAANQGKTINWSNGTLSNSSKVVPLGNAENNSTIITLLIISMISISSIGAYIYINKKKAQ